MTRNQEVDVLVLGGGSAGCVSASRLSERASLRVMLAEAGDDTPPGAVPAEIASSYPGRAYFNPRYSWPDLQATLGGAHLNDPAQRPRARYEQATQEHHDHLIDMKTGRVLEFVDPEIERLQQEIATLEAEAQRLKSA